jgi:hypothetical protein
MGDKHKEEKKKRDGEKLHEVASGMREIFSAIDEFLPKFLSDVFGCVTGGTDAVKLAEEVSLFYKNLVESGMDKDYAYELTKNFMMMRDKGAMIMQALTSISSLVKKPFEEEKENEKEKKEEKEVKRHHRDYDRDEKGRGVEESGSEDEDEVRRKTNF